MDTKKTIDFEVDTTLGKEPETIHHNITVPRKSFKEYREGLFYDFPARKPTASAVG